MIIFLLQAVTTEASPAIQISAPPNLILGLSSPPLGTRTRHFIHIYMPGPFVFRDAAAANDVCA